MRRNGTPQHLLTHGEGGEIDVTNGQLAHAPHRYVEGTGNGSRGEIGPARLTIIRHRLHQSLWLAILSWISSNGTSLIILMVRACLWRQRMAPIRTQIPG